MKTAGRILIILAAFALVMGMTYVAVNAASSGSSATAPGLDDDGQFPPNGERPNFGNGERPEFPGGERNEFRGERGGGWIFGAVKNTVVIAILVALIAGPKRWLRRRKRQPQVKSV